MTHIFMGGEYAPGAVIDYLSQLRPAQTVVGLSIGADETRLCRCSAGSGGAPELVALSLSGDGPTLPTLIGYQSGQVFIGGDARNAPDAIDGFWVPPEYWQAQCTTSLSYQGVMADYLSALWKSALCRDEELCSAAADGKLLLVLGCPDEGGWLGAAHRERLRALAAKATGCAQVAVLPETNAALMDSLCPDPSCAAPLGAIEPELALASLDGFTGCAGTAAAARGLCKLYIRLQACGARFVSEMKNKIRPFIERERRALMREVAADVCAQAMRDAADALRPLISDGEAHMRAGLIDAVAASVCGSSRIVPACDSAFRQRAAAHGAACRGEILKLCAELSPALYGVCLPANWRAGAEAPSGFSGAELDQKWLGCHISEAVSHSLMSSLTYGFIMGVALIGTYGLWPIFDSDSFNNMRSGHDSQDEELSPALCRKILEKFESPSPRLMKKLASRTAKILEQDGGPGSGFPAAMDELAELCIGSVTLLVRDENSMEVSG